MKFNNINNKKQIQFIIFSKYFVDAKSPLNHFTAVFFVYCVLFVSH